MIGRKNLIDSIATEAMENEPMTEPDGPPPAMSGFAIHFDFGGYAYCGTREHYRMTGDDIKVTCKRCLAKLGKDASV